MKAIMKIEPREGLVMEEMPIPEIGNCDVLIKTHKTSICGTDLHIYKWNSWAARTLKLPMVIGHEFMGRIAKVGKEVRHLKEGDRVSGEGHMTCGRCPSCRKGKKHLCPHTVGLGVHSNGCFAEYFVLPAENVFLLPDHIDDATASLFDPYGNAVHTALTYPLIGEDVLITGAGPIGVMAAMIAKIAGARRIVVTDRNLKRLSLAKKMGATETINIDQETLEDAMKRIGFDEGFSVGMEMSGNPLALNQMLDAMQPGGKIALLGLMPEHTQIDWDQVIFKMLTIKGIYGRKIFSTWYKMTYLLETGLDLSSLLTHEFPACDFEKGFQEMMNGAPGKVTLDWLK